MLYFVHVCSRLEVIPYMVMFTNRFRYNYIYYYTHIITNKETEHFVILHSYCATPSLLILVKTSNKT